MAKRGRPASFDRQEALERAMELFWARGYEGTTLEDLQTAMGGITPPSFYHAFGSKEALFREAVDLYIETVGGLPVQALDAAVTARDGVEAMLRRAAEAFSEPGRPQGCLLLLGATRCAPANRGAQEYLEAIRARAPEVFARRLRRGVAEGDLGADVDIGRLIAFYQTVAHGLAVRAADGASREDLMAAVDGAMAAWNGLTEPRGGAKAAKPGKPSRSAKGRG